MIHREHELQKACVIWFRLQYPEYALLLFAVPNGGNRNPREAARLKSEGVTAGISDLILLLPHKVNDRVLSNSLCIEFKTAKGKQQKTQKAFEKAVILNGSRYQIIRSVDEFIKLIEWHLQKP